MIKIGTSGFSFKDWIGTVYPKKYELKEALIYYEKEFKFNCVEINSTYYTLVSDKSFESMEKKTSSDFEFVVKAYKGITHDPFDYRLANKPNANKVKEDMKRFIYSIKPLKEKNKLGAVLLQFPVFFYPNEHSFDFILDCKQEFNNIPLVIEFRNNAWSKHQSFQFLTENNLSYCAVDEPNLPRLMPFINEVTSDIAYIRFHGRNKKWFNSTASERYNYLYSADELNKFLPEIKTMDKKSKKTYIFFNNCHGGFAVKNAIMLKGMLGLESKA